VLHRPTRLEGAMELLLTDLQHVDFTRDFDAGLRSLVTTLRRAPFGAGVPRAAPIAGPRATRPWRRAAIALVAVAALIASAATLAALTMSDGAGGSSTTTSAATTSPPTSLAQPASAPATPGSGSSTGPFRLLDVSEMTVQASSELPAEPGCGGTCTFGPANLIDGTLTTAWSEGQAGDGAGAWIVLTFDRPHRVVEVGMWPGWQRGEPCLFERNARPQDVLISFDNGRRPWLVPNEPGGATMALDVVTSSLRFDVRAVYPGSGCDGRQPDADMLISEIEIRVAPA